MLKAMDTHIKYIALNLIDNGRYTNMADLMDLEDKARLEFSKQTRLNIVNKLVADNTLPQDRADKEMLIAALDGLDRTILAQAKLKSDDQNQQNQKDIANMMTQVLLQVDSRRSGKRTSLPVIDHDIKPDNIVKGELEMGLQQVTFEEIMQG